MCDNSVLPGPHGVRQLTVYITTGEHVETVGSVGSIVELNSEGRDASLVRCTLEVKLYPVSGILAALSTAPSELPKGHHTRASLPFHDTFRKENYPAPRLRRAFTMAAMMPSASTSSGNPYDDDAVERDLIDPDDGAWQLPVCIPAAIALR